MRKRAARCARRFQVAGRGGGVLLGCRMLALAAGGGGGKGAGKPT